ncbi:MAG: hypothetical protein AAF961_08610, partial [Planctomycetota bacterium]
MLHSDVWLNAAQLARRSTGVRRENDAFNTRQPSQLAGTRRHTREQELVKILRRLRQARVEHNPNVPRVHL